MADLRKDANGRWLSNIEISEDLWKKLIDETRNGIIAQLQFIDRQLQSGNVTRNDLTILAGNYCFAVEEYGKLLLLKRHASQDGKVTLRYANEFRKHDKKFDTAITSLPSECTILQGPAFDPRDREPRLTGTPWVGAG